MLKLGVYAIYDEASNAFYNPYVARTNEEAIRAFGDDVKKPESAANKHPKDFSLYHIGYFDQASGIIEGPGECPNRISKATDFIDHKKK